MPVWPKWLLSPLLRSKSCEMAAPLFLFTVTDSLRDFKLWNKTPSLASGVLIAQSRYLSVTVVHCRDGCHRDLLVLHEHNISLHIQQLPIMKLSGRLEEPSFAFLSCFASWDTGTENVVERQKGQVRLGLLTDYVQLSLHDFPKQLFPAEWDSCIHGSLGL